MKKIGITMRYIYEDGTQKHFINNDYLKYVDNLFIPIALPIDKNIDELLELCDCFLVTGGDDMDSSWYNEPRHPKTLNVEPKMDVLDKTVIEYALKSGKPLLGICRGFQSLNVFLGGSLIQDIPNDTHRGLIDNVGITLTGEGNFFKEIYNNDSKINSYHHQGINRLANDLIPTVMSNGLIEAVEHKTLPIVAVQWHPEKLTDKESKELIKKFSLL